MNKMYVLNSADMMMADECTIEKLGIDQAVLMERAALAVVECVHKYNPKKVLCVCGNGNNGGDAVAVARILKMQGIAADVFMCGEPEKWKDSVTKQYDIFKKVEGRTVTDMAFEEYDIIVDGILGVSTNPRNLEGKYEEIVYKINDAGKKGAKIISVDIPTGVHPDKGIILNVAVEADETVAFAYYKPGHLLYPGASCCGKVTVADIGIRYEFVCDKRNLKQFTLPRNECSVSLPKRRRDGNKGTFGRVLIIAGSSSMYGACYLSALAAFRMGVGLVDIFTHECNREILHQNLPEAILHTYADDKVDVDELCKLMKRADAVLIGPGLSTDDTAHKLVEIVLKHCDKKLVVDADALNCIAAKPEYFQYMDRPDRPDVIFTPHPGELSRLLDKTVAELQADYIEVVKKYASDHFITVVAKGAGTVVSDGVYVYINQTGNDGMATAGSGDVLSGIVVALCVNNNSEFEAARKGVFLHGKAGDFAAHNMGNVSLMASDIIEALPGILKEENGF